METHHTVNEKIVELMPLVKKVSKKVQSRYGKKHLDLESEAYLALVEVINKHHDTDIKNVRSFVCRCVINHLMNHMRDNRYREMEELPDELLDDQSGIDVLAEALDCCQTDTERLVVSLRAEGYTLQEIEEKTGLYPMELSRMLDKIEIRYEGVFQ